MTPHKPALFEVQVAILAQTYEVHGGDRWPTDFPAPIRLAGDDDRLAREAVDDLLDREVLRLRKYPPGKESSDYGRGTRLTDSFCRGGFHIVRSFRTRREYDAVPPIQKSQTLRRLGLRHGSFFDDFPRSEVTLRKQDGRCFENKRACVTSGTIFLEDATLPVEEGDRIERRLPNGLTETFIVTDPGFTKGMEEFVPDHFQVKYRKGNQPTTPGFTINQHGPGARVMVNSPDSSVNVVVAGDAAFRTTRSLIEKLPDPDVQAKLSRAVDCMEREYGTPSFKDRYREFVSLAADHVTVLAPAISALAGLL